MAKLIEFYIPKDHHKDPRLDAAEPRGQVIELVPRAKKSA